MSLPGAWSMYSLQSKIPTTITIFFLPIHLFHLPYVRSSSLHRRRHSDKLGIFRDMQVLVRSSHRDEMYDKVTEPVGMHLDVLEKLLTTERDELARFMKMERRIEVTMELNLTDCKWFPYLDLYKVGETSVTSGEVLEALDPFITEGRKERLRYAVKNRTYSFCLVVEGLNDIANASAIFRSADALGFQSVHVIAFDCSKRFRENRHVSVGAEKWLDIELWDSTKECFDALKSRGYCIAATHVGTKAVSLYEMDWSGPTAIVVGNETRGISDEALELADTIFSIPMKGMVESFNVSVASALIMHHALVDRTSRLGRHGDLMPLEQQILLAEFSLRHSDNAVSIVHEHTKRKVQMPKL